MDIGASPTNLSSLKLRLDMAKYYVEVIFMNRRPNCAIGIRNSSYFRSNGRQDTFTFRNNGFTIEAERSCSYSDGSILNCSQNSLNGQILKGLLVYYALASDFPKLKNISILRKRQRRFGDFVYTETLEFQQPLTPGIVRNLHLSQADVNEILEETDKGIAVRTALSYWLKGVNSQDRYFKFDRYWKAFDRLLLHQGNTTRECDGIQAMKALIRGNAGLFVKSTAMTNTASDGYIRKFSWNKLLYKCSKRYTKPKDICRRATEYSDSRAIRLFQSLVYGPKVQTALSSAGLWTDVVNHFTANTATICDIDIVLLLSLSYTYYLRCKLFHGEVPDSTFKLRIGDRMQYTILMKLFVEYVKNSGMTFINNLMGYNHAQPI
jgi:hypothetical protein